MFDVESEAFLRAVAPDEIGGQPAHAFIITAGEIAGPGPFDFDHARAQIGQLAGRERRGDGVLQGDDSDSIERTRVFGWQTTIFATRDERVFAGGSLCRHRTGKL